MGSADGQAGDEGPGAAARCATGAWWAGCIDEGPGAAAHRAAGAWWAGHIDEATALATETLEQADGVAGRVEALIILGACAAHRGELDTAEELLARAAAESRAAAYDHGRSIALQYLAMLVLMPRGRFAPALAAADEAAHVDAAHTVASTGAAIAHAWVAQLTGDRAAAHRALDIMAGQASDSPAMAGAFAYLAAGLALDEERLDEAEALLMQAYSRAEQVGAPALTVGTRVALSRLSRARRALGAAQQWAADAVAAARLAGAPYLRGIAHLEAAWATLAAGELGPAEAELAAAVADLARLDASYDLSRAALAAAALQDRAGHPDSERTWLAAATRLVHLDHAFLLDHERAIALPLAIARLHSPTPAVRASAEALLEALREHPPQPLHIVGIGPFSLRQGGRQLSGQQLQPRRAGELLRLLLVCPGHRAHRDTVLEALWPGRGASAAPLLHQATSALRRALEPEIPERLPSRYLSAEHDLIALRLPPGSWVDFEQLRAALASADHGALDALLAGPDLTLFPEDRRAAWATTPREQLADLAVRGLTALAAHSLDGGDPGAALAYADRARRIDPWAEEATLRAMQACLALGDRTGAIRRFAGYRRALRRDLHLAPRPDILALAESLGADPQR